jgi:hypothetical protein
MSDQIKSLIELPKNGTKIAIFIFVGNFLFFFGNVYLSNGYVSKPTYEADVQKRLDKDERLNEKLHEFAVEIKGLSDHMEGDAAQNDKLKDLEQRMREQEKRK